jgi:cytochrome P450
MQYCVYGVLYRNCIGQEFALNEEKVILAHILRNFEISLPEDFKVEKMFLLILRPKDGLYLNLKIREH